MKHKQKIIVIIGPTCSGKSTAAMHLADIFNGEIISADAIQIYKQLTIGSAKPSLNDRQKITHHLIDLLNINEPYLISDFKYLAEKHIDKITSNEKIAVICGGSMLYIKALIHGLVEIPPISSTTKNEIETIWINKGTKYCYNWLNQLIKPEIFKFKDPQRVKRALAVKLEHGLSISEFQSKHQFKSTNFHPLYIGIRQDRSVLYNNINNRVIKMINLGLIDECKNILLQGYSPELNPLKSIGYKETFLYLSEKLKFTKLIETIQKNTRHYAKRQLTWYNKYNNIHWFDSAKNISTDIINKFYLQS